MSEKKSNSKLDQLLFQIKRRRIKYIDPKQQRRLAFEITLMVLTLPLLFYIFTISDLWTMIFFGDQAETMRNLFQSQLMILKKAWHVILIILVFIIFLSIFFTHKIFGPIYRFKQVLEAKINGEEDIHFTLRKGDYFQEFYKTVQMIALSKVETPAEVKLQAKGSIFDMQPDDAEESRESSSDSESE